MIATGSIPPRHTALANALLEYAPTDPGELAEWLTALPLDQAITVGMTSIADAMTRPCSIGAIQAALFALEARWAEAGPLLKPRAPFPKNNVAPPPETPPQDEAAPSEFTDPLSR